VHSQMNFGSGRGSGFAGARAPVGGTTEAIAPRHAQLDQPGRSFMQIHDSFIVAQSDEGFVIVDQHALHERMMYENLRQRVGSGNLESQRLLIPESFELTDTQAETARVNTDILEKLGIELAPFGPRTMAVQSFPVLLGKAVVVDFVLELLDLLSDKGPQLNAEALLDEVLNMAACKAAIKAGQKLSDSEIEALLAAGQNTEQSSRCPHGRPTTIRFTMEELTKQFKRT
jgi:DNA mismatch repair protein MutL